MGRRIRDEPPSSSSTRPLFHLKFKNPVTKARVAEALSGAQRMVESATDIAHSINDMGAKPSVRNYAALGVVVLSKLLGSTSFRPADEPRFFQPDVLFQLQNSVARIYARHPTTRTMGGGENKYQVTELESGHVVVFEWDGPTRVSGLYVLGPGITTDDSALPILGRPLWQELGTRIEVRIPVTLLDDPLPGHIAAWKPEQIYESEQGIEVCEMIRSYLDKGYSRGIILQGAPGTGKSCMVQLIASRLSMTTLILDQVAIRGLSMWGISRILEMLQPEVLIIDDMDRVPDLEQMLGVIDRIRERVKLLIATMNHEEELDPAVVRTGRFDQVIQVSRVCDPTDQLPLLPSEVIDEVRDWPVSAVRELGIRLEVEGRESLGKNLADLRERVRRNAEEEEEENEDSKVTVSTKSQA